MDETTFLNHMRMHELADIFLDRLPEEGDFAVPIPDMEDSGPRLINQDRVELLTLAIQDFIANVVAGLINAGSERDAVNEAEALHDALYDELKGWSDHPDNAPKED